jgi:hypothetical protein
MLSLESLINYIEPKQVSLNDGNSIGNSIGNGINKSLPDYFSEFFGGELTNFNLLKNRKLCDNDFLNFMNSILISIDNSYKILKKEIKKDKIKSLLKDLIMNFEEKNLYYKFNYNKNRKINKTYIQEYLYNILQNINKKVNKVNEGYIDQFIADYFGINIIFFEIENDNIILEKSYIINTNRFENKFNKLVPLLLLCKNEHSYYSIEKNNCDISLLKYSEHRQLINNFYIKFKVNIDRKLYEQKSLVILKEIAVEKNIDIMKKSEQTGKMIYKKKNELIDELGELDFK